MDALTRFNNYWTPVTESGCWLWTGALRGVPPYGAFTYCGKTRRAHRVAYELFVAPVPDDAVVCHRCDVTECVNPSHLFLGTRRDNIQDAVRKGRMATGSRQGAYTMPHRRPRGCGHGMAKLTEAQVIAIRADTRRRRFIAADYGIAATYVNQIKRRSVWRHVT